MDISLCDKIKQSLLTRDKDAPRDYIGASSIGHPCERKIWYQFKGVYSVAPPTLQVIFDMGKRIEDLILDYLSNTDIEVTRPNLGNGFLWCQDQELALFAGHMDAIITIQDSQEKAVLDIKTAKASSFQKFVHKGLKQWNMQYYAQLQAYMGMTKIKRAVLLAINKDTSEMHEEWIAFNELYYDELKTKARIISQNMNPPEKINRSPLFYICRMCGFKELCHE